jgi:putative PIN family toxin of toxin-antitoxin system
LTLRAVLDANVLVSGLLRQDGPPGRILDAWLDGQFRVIMSAPMLEELIRVLAYPRISQRIAPGQAERLIAMLTQVAEWVEVQEPLHVLRRDPSDNAYLACAAAATVGYLVTGNTAHFSEVGEEFQGVRIVTPRVFLDLLSST